jgi:phosphoribosylaminoimidazole-succinocarboxamide synthase
MAGLVNIPAAPVIDGWTHIYSGKVRDLYRDAAGRLLVVASDRISAFDWVLPTTVPDKGRILTALSLWWFEQLTDIVPNHIVSLDVPAAVAGRSMIVENLDMLPVECVARGHLTGSALSDYNATGSVCGIVLPAGLVDGSRLPEPIFTPATKADLGEHDENVTIVPVAATVGAATAGELEQLTIAVYRRAEDIARGRGVILADTKFEFGRRAADGPSGPLVLADEVLTPDSSRFWPAAGWEPGHAQPSFDKQYVRDWLTSDASGWDRHSGDAPPALPDQVIERTRDRYTEAYRLLTGSDF